MMADARKWMIADASKWMMADASKWIIVRWIPIVVRHILKGTPPTPRAKLGLLPVVPVTHAVGLPEIPVLIDRARRWMIKSKYPPAKPRALICEPLKAA